MIHGHDGRLLAMMEGAQNLIEETPDAQTVVLNWLTPLSKVYNTIQLAKGRTGRRKRDCEPKHNTSRMDEPSVQ